MSGITFQHGATYIAYAPKEGNLLQMSRDAAVQGWLDFYRPIAVACELPQIKSVFMITISPLATDGDTHYADLTDVNGARLRLWLTTDGDHPRIECREA